MQPSDYRSTALPLAQVYTQLMYLQQNYTNKTFKITKVPSLSSDYQKTCSECNLQNYGKMEKNNNMFLLIMFFLNKIEQTFLLQQI